LLLADLIADLAEAQQTLARCRSSRALRRMTRVTAQLSGLMCLTLIKLDERTTFRQRARIARLAAVEADDPATHSSLEARAQAATGCAAETGAALRRAEAALDRLDSDAVNTSAFGYNEAQLRFHEGNAFTHLGDIDAAWAAQERALTLCPAGDYMDRAMTQFDRASCLARGGDFTEAAHLAITTLVGLSSTEQEGIITLRAGEIVTTMPASHQVRQPVRELRELVTSMRDAKGN
jgi:tetratricopeptide (TPR) repeat protein